MSWAFGGVWGDVSNGSATPVVRHNLRADRTSFVGRRDELVDVGALLAQHRLVTVAGVGGGGKTRLASQWCWRAVDDPAAAPAGELWWVDLGAVTDPQRVGWACADVLGVRLDAGADPVGTLAARLRNRRMVLVLDTCEHLLDAVAALVEEVLAYCPQVTVLTTSREPLGVAGEVVWRIPTLAGADARRLFVERAALVATGPPPTGSDAAVPSICARLDGLPLAIELAAGWTRMLTPRQILVGLSERFEVLTGGRRRAVPRHRALEASMTWSHDLLDDTEQVVFRRLSVFVDTFDLAAATAVAGAPAVDAERMLPVLTQLLDKSLVVADARNDQVRYRLLDTVRQYAGARLAAAGELDATRDRHLDWTLHAVRAALADLDRDQDLALAGVDLVGENVTAALDWGLRPGSDRASVAGQLAEVMVMPWFLRTRTERGVRWLRRALARDGAGRRRLASGVTLLELISERPRRDAPHGDPTGGDDPLAQARETLSACYRSFFTDHAECERLGLAAAELGERAGDPFCRDFGTVLAAYSLVARDRYDEAVRLARPVLDASRRRGDRLCLGFAIGVEQYAAMQDGRLATSLTLGHAMVGVIAPLGDYFGVGTLTSNLALALCLAGDTAQARRIMAPIVESVENAPAIDVVGFQVPLGTADLRDGRWADALGWFVHGMGGVDDVVPDWTTARCLAGAVTAFRRLGRHAEAVDLLTRGQRLAASWQAPQVTADLTEQQAYLAERDDPAYATTLHHRALQIRHTGGLATFVPDSLDALAALTAATRPERAVRVLAASTAARAAMGCPRTGPGQDDHDRQLDVLRGLLSESDYRQATDDGAALTLDQAVDQVTRGRGRRSRPSSGWGSLSPAELDVVRLVAAGCTNAEVARRLFVSRSTVKTHLTHVFAKLGVANRTELAATAHEYDSSSG